MILEKLTERFLQNPSYFRKGAGYLAKILNTSKDNIYEAKRRARDIMDKNHPAMRGPIDSYITRFSDIDSCVGISKEAQLQNIIAEQEETIVDAMDKIAKYVGSEQNKEGTIKKFLSKRNLTPKEIQELAGVDNINTYVSRVWEKMQTDGSWTYSIDVRWKIDNFYNLHQLREKLKELMPEFTPSQLLPKHEPSERALTVILADDHVGAINKTNLFDKSPYSYKDRLDRIAKEILLLEETFEEVHIISLGDQMNGWNRQTTRGGHIVDSVSNEEQFDIYVSARINFYDKVFNSGVGKSYFVHDIENSNHSGSGMSYMANKALEIYLEGKYPSVYKESITEAIGGFQYGKHVVLMGHGKDEKFQKRPMPAVLDAKTDLYLYDFVQNKGYSPYSECITFYKGDLHQSGYQHGKFGRYINCPSLAGNSDYGDINFGNSKGGAILEVLEKDSYRVITFPVWF